MSNSKQKIVFVSGNFNILHPGHLRFLKFASEQGSRLIVGVFSKEFSVGAFLEDNERMESLSSVSFVDDVILIKEDLLEKIQELAPAVIIKGKEFEKRFNIEAECIQRLGGKLIFGSGEPSSSTSAFVDQAKASIPISVDYRSLAYLKRHDICSHDISSVLENFASLKVAIFGDTIVDQYVDCDPVGMSREDVTLVVSPRDKKYYLGGAGIVAAHAASLGAAVDFFTVLGEDENQAFVEQKCKNYGVDLHAFVDSTRPTTSKLRYRTSNKTLLRVNTFRQHGIQENIRQEILHRFVNIIEEKPYDLVIFSDFSYGMLSKELLETLLPFLKEKEIPFVADSQTSSQVGDLSKFKGAHLVTPTEHETRQTVQNNQDGLIQVSESLGDNLGAKHVFVTLGEDGVLIRSKNDKNAWWDTDDLPALNSNPKDVAGAGDAMLTASALSLCCDATIWQAAFIGSVASAIQVSQIGNTPIDLDKFKSQFSLYFESI